jgi:thioester reductase-like protein
MMPPAAGIRLNDSLEFRGQALDDGYGGDLLLTGATGFLGRYLLAELLDRTTATVHAPVATADFAAGYDLLRQRLTSCGRWNPGYARRIRPVPADLGQPWLGLAPGSFADLGARLDAIYHCAADDHLLKNYDELAPVNVHGTHELLKLASYGRGVRFHQLSIITVAPVDPAANRCAESWPDERRVICGAPDVLTDAAGYTRTRWVAEHLVAEAARRGLAASIYRTMTLTGDSGGGYPERDVLVAYIQGTVRAGVYPVRERVGHWTPVDYAARAIALLAAEPPGVYHIPGCTVPLRWVWEHIRRWGCPLRGGSDEEWRTAVRAAGLPLTYLLDDGPDLPTEPPEPDCSAALAAVGGVLGAPLVTAGLVGRYLDDMRGRGLL